MNSVTLFLIGACLSAALSYLLVHILRKSLADLLEELWESRARAGFWAAVACTTILLLGAFGGTSNGDYSRASHFRLEIGFFALVQQLRWTLFGLFSALMAVALAVMTFMGRVDRQRGSKERQRLKQTLDEFDQSTH